jgi:NADH:ubiquinone oxidoreductase subunit 5 (subunit L)/multisubunit Na+/H+ antiporter MnhA subunit
MRNPQIRGGFAQGRGDRDMIRRGLKGSPVTWIATTVAVAAVLAVAIVIGEFWTDTGDSEISEAGWFAMGLGIVITLALGIGLMSLVFFSNRRGYDEAGRKDR